jgi:hypothetical protein
MLLGRFCSKLDAATPSSSRSAAPAAQSRAATASTDKRLEIVPGRSHGLHILKSVPQTRTLVESFLRDH